MTLFRAAQAAAAAVIDIVFGEPFTFVPMRHVGGRLVDDPDRPSVDLVGVLTMRDAFSDPIGERNASGMSKGVASSHATSFATIGFKLPEPHFPITMKDRLVRVETGEIFEICGSPSTDLDHIAVRVARLGAA